MAVSGLGAQAASAGHSQEIATGRGSVVFTHHGEHLLAYDELRDGYGVEASVLWFDKKTRRFHREGVIDHRAGGGPARRNLKIREGSKVSLTMCLTKNGADTGKCTETQHGEA
jgi:hypothetical protein